MQKLSQRHTFLRGPLVSFPVPLPPSLSSSLWLCPSFHFLPSFPALPPLMGRVVWPTSIVVVEAHLDAGPTDPVRPCIHVFRRKKIDFENRCARPETSNIAEADGHHSPLEMSSRLPHWNVNTCRDSVHDSVTAASTVQARLLFSCHTTFKSTSH